MAFKLVISASKIKEKVKCAVAARCWSCAYTRRLQLPQCLRHLGAVRSKVAVECVRASVRCFSFSARCDFSCELIIMFW